MSSVVRYKDLYFRLIACLIGSHIILVYGETMSTFKILLYPGYYLSLLGSFIIAFILFSTIRQVFIKLDRNFDWQQRFAERLGLQIFFGLILPGFAAFLLAFVYFKIRNGSNILKTSYLRYDFQFILVLILAINIYYIAFFFYRKWVLAEQHIQSLRNDIIEDRISINKSAIQVSKGANNIILAVDDIAYLFRDGDSNYLKTMSGENFYLGESLDEMQQQLPEQKFFRANRQLIVNRAACKGFSLMTYGKLDLQLTPKFAGNSVVSQKRAVIFRKWTETHSIGQN